MNEKLNTLSTSAGAQGTQGTTVLEEPKFQLLLNSAHGIDGVIDHLRELHGILGVCYDDNEPQEDQKSPYEPSLVRMLDELPRELANRHSKIHDMITAIKNQLN